MITNLKTYLDISIEYQAKSKMLMDSQRKPIEGRPGRFVTLLDPTNSSFKFALISVVFAGIYLDALLHIESLRCFGDKSDKFIDKFDHMTY